MTTYKAIVSKREKETNLLMQRSNAFSNKRKAKQWATANCHILRPKRNFDEVNWMVIDVYTNAIVSGGTLRPGGTTWRLYSKSEIEFINLIKK